MKEQNEVLVKVEGLSKKFCKDLKTSLWYGVKDLLSGVKGNTEERELRPKEFWAVKDVSFELRRGECLGLIGHNGAGKSTLLKILNGLINPDAGKVTIKGRVGALIELGAGFSPILSGRENVYNNGAVLGFSRKEIDAKLHDIIAFAELEEFIDMPVQNYSSGMKVRLGFAVAAQMEPDVLIIDEVLAVGDVAFRMKCYNTINELQKRTAIIFVSHSMPQVAKLSSSALLLSRGSVKNQSDNVSNIINEYFLDSSIDNKEMISGNGKARIIKKNFDGQTSNIIKKGNNISISFELKVEKDIEKFIVRGVIYDEEFKGLLEINSLHNNVIFKNDSLIKKIDLSFINPLNNGNYSFTLILLSYENGNSIGERLLRFESFYSFKSFSDVSFDSYIPLSLKANWLLNDVNEDA